MTANLFGGRFMAVREPAWHQLGKVLDNPPDTAEEAFKIAGLDYHIQLAKIEAIVEEGKKVVVIDDRLAMMREPVPDDDFWRPLGVVSPKYKVIQNMDLARILDRLGLPAHWPIETVGALGNGETIFCSFQDGEHQVLGLDSETLKLYFLLSEKRDGGSSLKLSFTPVRVVCQNTLELGLSQAVVSVKIAHLEGAEKQVEDRVKLLTGLDKSVKDTLSLFDRLAAFKISDKMALSIITKTYPAPIKPKRLRVAEEIVQKEPAFNVTTEFAGLKLSDAWATESLQTIGHNWEREAARVESLRSQTYDLYKKFNDEQPKVAQTGWAVVNAVVESEDFRDGPAGMFESTLWGSRAATKAVAMQAVMEKMKE